MLEEKEMKVDLSTAHPVTEISPWQEKVFRTTAFCFGAGIALMIYQECLHDPECNSIAVGFFAVLSLIFFSASGLPVEKFVNGDVVKNIKG